MKERDTERERETVREREYTMKKEKKQEKAWKKKATSPYIEIATFASTTYTITYSDKSGEMQMKMQ